MKYRKKPVVIEATQWFKNGDHPNDYTEDRQFMEAGQLTMKPGAFFREHGWEGGIVRYFRRPDIGSEHPCPHCGVRMHEHGWIDTLEGNSGAQVVCPGDFIVTGVQGERYPVKPDIFDATYEAVS